MILVLFTLTPFTMANTLSLFYAFRATQTGLMVLSTVHGLKPNVKLKAILEGCANLNHLWGSTLESHVLFWKDFFRPNCVYIRFTHSSNMQPKFYIGSASHQVLDREYSWCREQDHGPDVDPTSLTDFSQPYILRMVCRRRLPIDPSDQSVKKDPVSL